MERSPETEIKVNSVDSDQETETVHYSSKDQKGVHPPQNK